MPIWRSDTPSSPCCPYRRSAVISRRCALLGHSFDRGAYGGFFLIIAGGAFARLFARDDTRRLGLNIRYLSAFLGLRTSCTEELFRPPVGRIPATVAPS